MRCIDQYDKNSTIWSTNGTIVTNGTTGSRKNIQGFLVTIDILEATAIVTSENSSTYISSLCLCELMSNVPVNSYGHVGTLPPFYMALLPKMRCHDIQQVLKI